MPKFAQNLGKNSWTFNLPFILSTLTFENVIIINIIHLLIASKSLNEMLKSQNIQPISIKDFLESLGSSLYRQIKLRLVSESHCKFRNNCFAVVLQ